MRYFLYCRKSQEAEDRQILSMLSQRTEAEKRFVGEDGVEIVGVFEEAMSAKAPGRPIFNDMIARIEAGEAEGIVAWAPDRLARNSIDGGRIVYLLDTVNLRDLKFLTYTFENNSQGKFMLSIMFGQSKYYSDALSENVKRGNRTKASLGWRPGSAPLGYLNDQATKTIVVDPAFHPMIREMFDLVLTGGRSAKQVARIAREEWGLRSPVRRRGGAPIHDSLVHRILTNPFYAGVFRWDGQLVEGKHHAVVSLDEFKAVQAAIRRPTVQRAKRQSFPFVGLIRCGACQRAVTAEEKVNRWGTKYVYYHCTRGKRADRCRQPSIRAEEMETQLCAWLASEGAMDAVQRAERLLDEEGRRASAAAIAIRQSATHALAEARRELSELTTLRLRLLVDDEEFVRRRGLLQEEVQSLARRLDQLARPDEGIPPFEAAISLVNQAVELFTRADADLKRKIIKATSSHLSLIDKKLSVEAAKWLSFLRVLGLRPIGLGLCDEVHTLGVEDAALRSICEELLRDPATVAQFAVIREVMSRRPQSPECPQAERAEHR